MTKVADVYRCDVNGAARLPVMEFLNAYSFALDKERMELERIKKQNAAMRSKIRRR